jgi:hypothetical protein
LSSAVEVLAQLRKLAAGRQQRSRANGGHVHVDGQLDRDDDQPRVQIQSFSFDFRRIVSKQLKTVFYPETRETFKTRTFSGCGGWGDRSPRPSDMLVNIDEISMARISFFSEEAKMFA